MKRPEYILDVPEAETLVSGLRLEKGEYVCERANAGAFLNQSQRARLRAFDLGYRPGPPLAGESVLVIRPGGFGDLLFCTPLFREMSAMGCRVSVACLKRFSCILENNPDISDIVEYPVRREAWEAADRHVWLERVLEDGVTCQAETFTGHASDLFAKAAGVFPGDMGMRYVVSPEEERWAKEAYPKRGPRAGIQLAASAKNRSYPWTQLQIAAGLIAADGIEVMLMGSPGMLRGADGPFVDLTAAGLTMRQTCAVAATCDAIFAPDSSLCHVAGALGIPALAVFGPFLAQTRTKYSPSVTALNGVAECAPCMHHDDGRPWPEGCPGKKTGSCAALASIPPALVAAQISSLCSRRSS